MGGDWNTQSCTEMAESCQPAPQNDLRMVYPRVDSGVSFRAPGSAMAPQLAFASDLHAGIIVPWLVPIALRICFEAKSCPHLPRLTMALNLILRDWRQIPGRAFSHCLAEPDETAWPPAMSADSSAFPDPPDRMENSGHPCRPSPPVHQMKSPLDAGAAVKMRVLPCRGSLNHRSNRPRSVAKGRKSLPHFPRVRHRRDLKYRSPRVPRPPP